MDEKIKELLKIENLKLLREKLRNIKISNQLDEILDFTINHLPQGSLLMKALYTDRLRYTPHKMTELMCQKAIQSESRQAIECLLMYQMCSPLDLIKVAIKEEKEKFAYYLLDDKHFYVSHEQKNKVVMDLYSQKNETLLKNIQAFILKSDYTPFFPPRESKILLAYILQSGQFQYIQLAQENLKVNFLNKQALKVSDVIVYAMKNGFINHDLDTQIQFLNYLNQPKNDDDIYKQYFFNLIYNNQSQDLFCQMLYKLIKSDVIGLAEYQKLNDSIIHHSKIKYFKAYQEFEAFLKEKEHLENVISDDSKTTKNNFKM